MRRRQGCLAGLLELALLSAVFDWLEDNFGFGRGCSCSGLGCGVIILVLFMVMACGIISGTNWFRLGF